ncbi:hypothetical protein DFJ74DRAFT_696383 [Hyaloraphidium curvatum]|nr:hypothetical protein DFJ74DRAFT_696383 [Hyaloraphidium curvatum]
MPLPVVDFAGFGDGAEVDSRVASEIFSALSASGFMVAKNLFPPSFAPLLAAAFDRSAAFFARDGEYKRRFSDAHVRRPRRSATHWGFTAFGQERFEAGKVDQKEVLDLCKDLLHRGSHPDELAGQDADWATFETFLRACHDASLRLYSAIALSLGLPRDHFDAWHKWSLPAAGEELRFLHYPPQPPSRNEPEGQIRAGAHTDYGSATLLFQKDVGGLQVLHPQRGWTDVPVLAKPGEEHLYTVVNTADLMEWWTNGLYPSTAHRVAMPRNEGESAARYSIAYFCHANDPVPLDPIAASPVVRERTGLHRIRGSGDKYVPGEWEGAIPRLKGIEGHVAWNPEGGEDERAAAGDAEGWLLRRMGFTRSWKYENRQEERARM